MTRVAVLWNAANPANASVWEETQTAARALGLLLYAQEVRGWQDFAGAFARTAQGRPEALLVLVDSLINMHHHHIVAFATQQHLPSLFTTREPVVAGGLLSYGPNIPALFRRAATYVDKILKGANPPTCRWSSRRSSSWSSTSRLPRPSGSRFPQRCSSRRTRRSARRASGRHVEV